jgi:YD repeat-containing protein
MMRLAEDGPMFTIARFEKQFSYLQGHSEILRIACRSPSAIRSTETVTRSSDDVRRLVAATDPLGHMTRYDYSPLNQIIKVTNPLGNFTSFS